MIGRRAPRARGFSVGGTGEPVTQRMPYHVARRSVALPTVRVRAVPLHAISVRSDARALDESVRSTIRGEWPGPAPEQRQSASGRMADPERGRALHVPIARALRARPAVAPRRAPSAVAERRRRHSRTGRGRALGVPDRPSVESGPSPAPEQRERASGRMADPERGRALHVPIARAPQGEASTRVAAGSNRGPEQSLDRLGRRGQTGRGRALGVPDRPSARARTARQNGTWKGTWRPGSAIGGKRVLPCSGAAGERLRSDGRSGTWNGTPRPHRTRPQGEASTRVAAGSNPEQPLDPARAARALGVPDRRPTCLAPAPLATAPLSSRQPED
jgi:hypothetical protein